MKRPEIRIYVSPKLYLKAVEIADEIGLNVTEYVKHILIEKVDPNSIKKNEKKKEDFYQKKIKKLKESGEFS